MNCSMNMQPRNIIERVFVLATEFFSRLAPACALSPSSWNSFGEVKIGSFRAQCARVEARN